MSTKTVHQSRCIIVYTSAVKINGSILVFFFGGGGEIRQSGSLLHKEAVDSYFKLISLKYSPDCKNQLPTISQF